MVPGSVLHAGAGPPSPVEPLLLPPLLALPLLLPLLLVLPLPPPLLLLAPGSAPASLSGGPRSRRSSQ